MKICECIQYVYIRTYIHIHLLVIIMAITKRENKIYKPRSLPGVAVKNNIAK